MMAAQDMAPGPMVWPQVPGMRMVGPSPGNGPRRGRQSLPQSALKSPARPPRRELVPAYKRRLTRRCPWALEEAEGCQRHGGHPQGRESRLRHLAAGPLAALLGPQAPSHSCCCGGQGRCCLSRAGRNPLSDLAFNGDLAQLASSEPPTDVSKAWVPSSPGSTSPGLPVEASGSAPESPRPSSPDESSPRHSQLPEAQSPAASGASPCLPKTLASPSATPPDEDSCHPPSPGLPSLGALEASRPGSPPLQELSGRRSPEQPPAALPQPLTDGGELLDLPWTLSSGDMAATGGEDLRPVSLAQRRFSEGVLQPPGQDQEKLGGSLAALPQTQGSQSALDHPFGSGTQSSWSLSQSFEWTFPTRPSGLGVWRLDSPPPSPITEAPEAAEAAEAGDWAASSREEGVSQQARGAPPAPEGPGRPGSWMQADDLGTSPTQKGDGESHPQPAAVPLEPLPTAGDQPGPALLQAEERYEEREPLPGQGSLLPLPTREAALPILEPVLGQRQPAPPDQPCVLFAAIPDPGQALPAKEEAMTLAQAETTEPRTEVQDPRRASPEPAGPESSSHWLDDLLASPSPSAGGARRGAGSELKDTQTPSACSEGLLGWAQKDLQSEFGIVADTHSRSFSPCSWSQDTSQDYGLRSASPRGGPGLGERDWTNKCGHGVGEGSSREWASRCGIGQEGMEVGSQDGSGVSAPGGLTAQDQVIGKAAQPGTPQGQEVDVRDWEFRERDSQGSYSSQGVEIQGQEFGKRDSLGTYCSQDASFQDWEFGKRDSLGASASQHEDEQSQELGKKDQLGRYGSQDAGEPDQEFGKSSSSLSTYSSRGAGQPDQDFGKSAWMRDYSRGGSSTALGSQDRGFGMRALSAGFSPEEAQQQDEEFEKKILSGRESLGEASRDVSWPEEAESGGLLSPSSPQSQDGALGQRDQSSWQGGSASQEVGGLQGRQQAGGQSPGDADREDREVGQRGWASDFSLSVVPQPEAAFSPGQRDWSGDFCVEAAERSRQFGIIGNDRASGAGLSPSGKIGGGHFVAPGETLAGTMDWRDQLGLRNLEVSSCVRSGGLSEAREGAMGQVGWADNLGLRDVELAGRLETGGSVEPRGIGVGEKDWTAEVGLRGRDLAAVGEVGDHSQARESGVGQTDWSGVEAGEFLKSRERGVGQADWTPDPGLRNRELGAGQVDWGDNLGLRNLEMPCDLESESSRGPRGCGVGQTDWTQDSGLRNVELLGALREAREHGVGEVSQSPEPGLRNDGVLSPGLEARDPSEARELGVGKTSGPETQGGEDPLPSVAICPEEPGSEAGESPGFGASPGGCLARSPPSGSQGPLEGTPAASCSGAAARRESAASGLRELSEEEGATAGADQGEPLEPGWDRLPSWRPQPDGEARQTEEVDGTWGPAGTGQSVQDRMPTPQWLPQGPPASSTSQDFSFIEDTEILDSAMYRSRANLGRKRGHRAPAIRPGGTLGLSKVAESDARLFQDSTEPRASRVPSSDEEVAEEPQNRRTRVTKGLKVNLFPGLSPSALKAKLRSRNRSADEGEPTEGKSSQKEPVIHRSKSCKVPGLGKPLALPPKPEKSSGSEGSSPNWLQALKLKKKKV
ncbi:182 kDa tankyrase-1-binding protein isoform X2 [Lagenorhynchus albirostris]|uniref:182 kDa tankyrase-1-binding protein isoform X2 n=1 Tax=Lagenorhynchus albirostris TaxID=27610 RepID=UPI0028EE3952|nr:182 kDa tankyrase-1-binding protein isoform X2 [Lagenorhynchus albirostris]